jgi:hypothetical protein
LLCALYPLLAIVPAHFSTIDEEIHRYPIKTAALALTAPCSPGRPARRT